MATTTTGTTTNKASISTSTTLATITTTPPANTKTSVNTTTATSKAKTTDENTTATMAKTTKTTIRTGTTLSSSKRTGSTSALVPTLALSLSAIPTSIPALPTLVMTTQAYQTPTVGVPVGRNPYVFTSSHTNGYTFVVVGSLLGAILVLYMAFRALLYVRSRLWVKKGANSDLWFDQKHGSAFFGSKNDSEKLLTYSDGSDLLVIDHQGSGSEASQSSQQGRSYRNALAGKTSRALMYVSPLEQYMNPSSLSPYTTSPSFMGLSFVSETPSMVNSGHPLLQSSTPSQSDRLIRPPSQYLDDLLGQ